MESSNPLGIFSLGQYNTVTAAGGRLNGCWEEMHAVSPLVEASGRTRQPQDCGFPLEIFAPLPQGASTHVGDIFWLS